eukprot:Clim_evm1s237 gene=Clim_evmTU1s237
MSKSDKPITLYTAGTPNGWKASIMLEECGVQYNVERFLLSKLTQKEEWFLKINPNGRIPAIVDHETGINSWESAAVLIYLAEKYNRTDLLPPTTEPAKRAAVLSWVMFQMGGQGPMQGQANHFLRYAPETIEYGIKRYQNESRRLYEVMERSLSKNDYIAGDSFTIADIALIGWAVAAPWAGLEIEDLKGVQAWIDRCRKRESVRRGLDVPEPNKMLEALADPEHMKKIKEEAAKMMVSHK